MRPATPPFSSLALFAVLALIAPTATRAAVCDGISDTSASSLTTVRVPGTYARPVLITAPPEDTSRVFIVEQDGTVRIVKDGVLLPAAFLDVSALTRSPADLGGGDEEGLLGLAFHPAYATNGLFFIYHTDSTGANNLVVRYARDAGNPDLADPATRQVFITFPHPSFNNHNGGMVAFAPDDGHLYVGTGDGGGGCDTSGNAQNPASPLGKLLRVDVAVPITVETWAIGLRNPWRWSFDRLTSDLYIGDVGQDSWEEIDYRPAPRSAGDNFAWVLYEGSDCPNPSCGAGAPCNSIANPILPIVEHNHGGGACSVTGGYVYRGCRMSELSGRYFYADYCAAFIKSFRMVGGAVTDERVDTAELAPGGGAVINQITSFGEDARGEIYIADRGGQIYKIVPILPNLQVSGPGAALFSPGVPDWGWEDLQLTSGHPIAGYHVYRSTGNGSGTFDCVFQSALNTWIGGDTSVPAPGGLFSYLVTAVIASGQETSPGTGTGGTPRTLSALSCPT